jgi:hypothetical protein
MDKKEETIEERLVRLLELSILRHQRNSAEILNDLNKNLAELNTYLKKLRI